MIKHTEIKNSELHDKIRTQQIQFGGNVRLKIYGLLTCKSGKRMKKINRLFFKNEKEAIENGYRPCGHCMRKAYQKWKDKNNKKN